MPKAAVNKGDIITNDYREGIAYYVYDIAEDGCPLVEETKNSKRLFPRKFKVKGGFLVVSNIVGEYDTFITKPEIIEEKIDTSDFELEPIPMNIEDYEDFVYSMKVFPEKHAIVYPALGLVGEAGEVAEKVKKWLRGDKELDRAELVKEMGDVLWYITALAIDLGYGLQDVVDMNVEKLSSRKERGVVKGDGDNR